MQVPLSFENCLHCVFTTFSVIVSVHSLTIDMKDLYNSVFHLILRLNEEVNHKHIRLFIHLLQISLINMKQVSY